MRTLFFLASLAYGMASAETALWQRGYSVIPTPQRVMLQSGDVALDGSWFLKPEGFTIRWLVDDLRRMHGYTLATSGTRPIRLSIASDVAPEVADPELRRQAYRLQIAPDSIRITGFSDAGLFYGVQTLLQLVRADARGNLTLPVATIEDWPKLQLRFLHWDTKNHQDRMETLKRYLDWSARLKINMIGFELEDKFEYPSHPVIGAPGAFTTAELQEIVNYGLERFIQVVPVVQSPAHFSYVLKHPEFAKLRADGNNYQASLCNEDTYKLIFDMYDDAIKATKGVDYFFVSTDEVYYAGIEGTCGAYNPATRSQKLAEFDRRAHDYLAKRGRRMLAWLEYPLQARELATIPNDVIDGVMGNETFLPIEQQKGMRQLVYTSMQGGEYLFPDYLTVDASLDLPPAGADDPFEFERGSPVGRITGAFADILRNRVWQAKPIGMFGAAWDDSGLHNETFWLGWSAAAQYAWNPGTVNADQQIAEFMRFYYGAGATGMIENYRMLQAQSRAWQRTWDRIPSKVRGPGYGNSEGKGVGTARYDETLLPGGRFVKVAQERRVENERLTQALVEQMGRDQRNQYNLEVMAALSRFIGHHWRLIEALASAEREQERAKVAKNPKQAAQHLSTARDLITGAHREGLELFGQLTAVFEKSRYPKGRSVNGRSYVHVLDDTKDHWAARTADLSYMFAAERSLKLEEYAAKLTEQLKTYE